MPPVATAAVTLAFILDLTLAEFPDRIHPVAGYGRLLEHADRDWRHPRLAGGVIAILGPLTAAILTASLIHLLQPASPLVIIMATGLVLFSTTSLRMLLTTARSVIEKSETALTTARQELPALVGRDAATLTPAEVRSAAVESTAENLADGLVAPLLAFAVLAPWSVPVGAGGAVWVKAVNTGDSMFGYPSRPIGFASARLDDLVMWLPARLTAVLITIAAADPAAIRRATRWAKAPPSPNAGWPMATLAVALDVQLRKPGVYALGNDSLPSPTEAIRGVRVVGIAGGIAVLTTGVVVWF